MHRKRFYRTKTKSWLLIYRKIECRWVGPSTINKKSVFIANQHQFADGADARTNQMCHRTSWVSEKCIELMVGDSERFGRNEWRTKTINHILETNIQANNQTINGQTRAIRTHFTELCVDGSQQLHIEENWKTFAARVDAIESDE